MTANNYAELVARLHHEADDAFEAGYQQHEDSLREAADAIRSLRTETVAAVAELKESRERCAEQTRKGAELAQAVIDCQTWTANVERHVTGIHRAEITSLRAELAGCRRALEECRAALYGAIGVCGNIGNIQHAINLATAALAGKGEGEKHE